MKGITKSPDNIIYSMFFLAARQPDGFVFFIWHTTMQEIFCFIK